MSVRRIRRHGKGTSDYDVTLDKSREQFERLARSPMGWLLAATDLRLSAELVGHRFAEAVSNLLGERDPGEYFHVGAAFQMLAGFSIEALLKGIAIARDPGLVSKGALPKWLLKHDLAGLMGRLKLPLTDQEAALVHRLAEAVVWRGRYPVPRYSGELRGPNPDFYVVGVDDLHGFRALFTRLEMDLSRAMGYVGGPLGEPSHTEPPEGSC